MAASIDTLVFTPVGPKSKPDYVIDTVESFLHYFNQASSALLIVNDTGRQDIHEFLPKRENLVIYDAPPRTEAPGAHNTRGNSFANQIEALRHVSRLFDWKCALRLDDDALIIGPRPDVDALLAFEAGERIGMLGAYLFRGDGTNKEPAMAEKGRQLLRRIFSPEGARNLHAWQHLLKLAFRSLIHGHSLGHMCTGGAFFMSRAAYDEMCGLFGDELDIFRGLPLEDDFLFSLHCGAAGYKLRDFSRQEDVMAINFRGLPMSLEELLRHHKKVVHPVKDLERPEHEREVRAFFKQLRERGGHASKPSPAEAVGAAASAP